MNVWRVVFAVENSIGPITLISGGFINDRLGPKWVVFAGLDTIGRNRIFEKEQKSRLPAHSK